MIHFNQIHTVPQGSEHKHDKAKSCQLSAADRTIFKGLTSLALRMTKTRTQTERALFAATNKPPKEPYSSLSVLHRSCCSSFADKLAS